MVACMRACEPHWVMAQPRRIPIESDFVVRVIAGGTELRAFSQPIMEASLKASNEVNAEIAAANADFKKVLESMRAFRNEEYSGGRSPPIDVARQSTRSPSSVPTRRVFWYDRAVGLGDLGIKSAVEPAGRPDFRHVEFD
jgi:hypothetical protein